MEGASRKTKRILVVDDSSLVRHQIEQVLQHYGYETVAAGNGVEGLKALFDNPDIDLVISDAIMPHMDGRTMVAEIRSHERLKGIPVLILASPEHVNMVAECMAAGCNDYLLKPVDQRLLYQRIQTLVESHPRTYRRVSCHVVAEVSTGREEFTGELREIGEGGVSLLTATSLETSDIVRLAFELPRNPEPVVVGAEVVYSQADEEGLHLSGLRFVVIDRETLGRIRKFTQGEGTGDLSITGDQ